MSNWISILQSRLISGERLVTVVENLSFGVFFVPHIRPDQNYVTIYHSNRKIPPTRL